MKPLTREEISKLSNQDLYLELAKRGIERMPTRANFAGLTQCPHCGHTGPIEKDFGTRVMRGEVYPQSWCSPCRSGAELPAGW